MSVGLLLSLIATVNDKEVPMFSERAKKTLLAITLASTFILSAGYADSSVTSAQYRVRRWGAHERIRPRHDRVRIWQSSRPVFVQPRVVYRSSGSNRLVGYYDRFGRFHARGFYDRFGRFHQY